VGEIVYAISITLLTKAISEYVTPKLVVSVAIIAELPTHACAD